MHPKMCFGSGCVPLGSVCLGVQIFPLLPRKNIFQWSERGYWRIAAARRCCFMSYILAILAV